MFNITSPLLERIANGIEEHNRLLQELVYLQTPQRAFAIEFYEVLEDNTQRRTNKMAIKAGKIGKAALKILDAKGNDAVVDGIPQWTLSDSGLGELKVAEDGMSAEFIPVGHVGMATVDVSVDADLSEGVKTITKQALIAVIAGEAENVIFEFIEAEPVVVEPQPEPPVEEPQPEAAG